MMSDVNFRGHNLEDLNSMSRFTPFLIYTSEDLKPHPFGLDMVQTVTGNLLEISSAQQIEIIKGVK